MICKPLSKALLILGFTAAGSFGMAQAETSLVQTGNPETWCRNGAFPAMSDHYRLVEIVKPGPLQDDYDISGKDAQPCPSDIKGRCVNKKAFMAKGTRMVVATDYGHFACVMEPISGWSGWIDKAALRAIPAPAIVPADWTGKWIFYDDVITLKPGKGGTIHATGSAVWYGNLMSDGSRNTHVGDFEFEALPQGDRLKNIPDDPLDCAVELIHLGVYLVVRDNGHCGGMNVSFNGIYRHPKLRR